MSDAELRVLMRKVGEALAIQGYCHAGTGNISVKNADGSILASPSGSSLGSLSEEEIAHVSLHGHLLSGRKATKELPFHMAIYESDPSCKAIVHLHTMYATVLSCMEESIRESVNQYTPYVSMKVSPIQYILYSYPGSPALAEEVRKYPEAKAFLLGNHGLVTKGSTLYEAVSRAEELEWSCQIAYMLHDKPCKRLSADEIAELKELA